MGGGGCPLGGATIGISTYPHNKCLPLLFLFTVFLQLLLSCHSHKEKRVDLVSIFFIAVALAMDAFAVSITNGIAMCTLRIRPALLIAFFFGAFQAIMPLLGWLAGFRLKNLIVSVDHWIAFALLSFIGGKMIYEATVLEKKEAQLATIQTLFLLAIATSIDAFAVGITFVFLNVNILMPVIIIGIVTFIISYAGVWIGCNVGKNLSGKAEIIGGIILIIIGTKILIEHLFFQ